MKVHSSFTVPVEREIAWRTLTDMPRIAPCMPGARIDSRNSNTHKPTYTGLFTVKVGPVRASYAGEISIEEIDENAGRIVLLGSGSDSGGAGSVSARITGVLREEPDQCVVELVTDLDVKGRLSQFTGRSSMVQGIADRIVGQFAANVSEEMLHPRAEQKVSKEDSQPVEAMSRLNATDAAESAFSQPQEFDALAFGLATVKDSVNFRMVAVAAGAVLAGWFLGRLRLKPHTREIRLVIAPDGLADGSKS